MVCRGGQGRKRPIRPSGRFGGVIDGTRQRWRPGIQTGRPRRSRLGRDAADAYRAGNTGRAACGGCSGKRRSLAETRRELRPPSRLRRLKTSRNDAMGTQRRNVRNVGGNRETRVLSRRRTELAGIRFWRTAISNLRSAFFVQLLAIPLLATHRIPTRTWAWHYHWERT
jgi:hypothetical protein